MNPAVLGRVDLILDVDHIANITGDVMGVILSTAAQRTDSAHKDRLKLGSFIDVYFDKKT
jgi:hypothetical protein